MSDQENSEDQVILQESQQSDQESDQEEDTQQQYKSDEEEESSNSQSPNEVEASITQLESPMQSGNYLKKQESIIGEQSSPHERRFSFNENNEKEQIFQQEGEFNKKQRISTENEEYTEEVLTEVNPDIQQTKLFQRFVKLEEEKKKLISKEINSKDQKQKAIHQKNQQQAANQPKIINYDNPKVTEELYDQESQPRNNKGEYYPENQKSFQPIKSQQSYNSREQPSPSDKKQNQYNYEDQEVQEEISQTKQDFFSSKLTRNSSLGEEKELQGFSTHVGLTSGINSAQGQSPDLAFYQQQQFLFQQQIPQAGPMQFPQMQQSKGMQQPLMFHPQQFYPLPAAFIIPPQYYQQFQQSQTAVNQTQEQSNSSTVSQQTISQQSEIKKQYEEQLQEEQKQKQKIKQNLDEVNDKFLNYKFDKENEVIYLQEQIQELKEKTANRVSVAGEDTFNEEKEQEYLEKIEELERKFQNTRVERDMLDKKLKQFDDEQVKSVRGDKEVRKQIQDQTLRIKELEDLMKSQEGDLQSLKVNSEKLKQELSTLKSKEEKQNQILQDANYKIKQYESDLNQARKKLKEEQQMSKQYQIEQESMKKELQKAQDSQKQLENQVEQLKNQNFEIKQDVAESKRKEQQNSQIIEQLSRELNNLKSQLQYVKVEPQQKQTYDSKEKSIYDSKEKSSTWQSIYQSNNFSQHQDSSVLLESPIRPIGNYNNMKESTNSNKFQNSQYSGVYQAGFGQKNSNQQQQSTVGDALSWQQSQVPYKQIQLNKSNQGQEQENQYSQKSGRSKQSQQNQESIQYSYNKSQTQEASSDFYQNKNKKNLQDSPNVKKTAVTFELDYSNSENQEISQLSSFSSKQSKQSQIQNNKKSQKGILKSQHQQQQNSQEEGLIFPSENKNLRNKSQQISHFDTQLMQLQLEKDKLEGEINKLEEIKQKTKANMQRKSDIELELDILNNNIAHIRKKLRDLNVL